MPPGQANPAKLVLRNEVAAKIAALTAEEKKLQSQIIFQKCAGKSLQPPYSKNDTGELTFEFTANLPKMSNELAHLRQVIEHPYYKTSKRVALYMSTDQEVDTAPLIDHVKARGAAAFVPQYAGGNMKMLRILEGDEEKMGLTKHGIAQHAKDVVREDALESEGLDLIIAPGLAFTRTGHRLGHGGGYYDRYIAKVRSSGFSTKVIALAFDCQVVDQIPIEECDQSIDDVISAI